MNADAMTPFRERIAEINDLLCTVSVLTWDASVMMPSGGQAERANQLATLSRVVRERLVCDGMLRDLDAAERWIGSDTAATLEAEYRRREVTQARAAVEILNRIPERLVTDLAYARSVAQPIWADARRSDDFERFAPALTKVVELTRELAECVGYEDHPYDAMLRLYEPDMTVARLQGFFDDLRATLAPLLDRVRAAGTPDRGRMLRQAFAPESQRAFGLQIAESFGWDASRGRLDVSVHPFEVSFGRNDVRMTTRYEPDALAPALFGIFHETGHALYEQNVDPEARADDPDDRPSRHVRRCGHEFRSP